MAANTGCGGRWMQIGKWRVSLTVRYTMTPFDGDGAIRIAAQTLETVRNETLAQFAALAEAVETNSYPPFIATTCTPEEVVTEDPATETPGYLLSRERFDPICSVWGDVNGVTLTVVSCDTIAHSLAAYRAAATPLPAEFVTLKPAHPQPKQTTAQQETSHPVANLETKPEQSESGTYELGEYDYNSKAYYAQEYGGKAVAFVVEKISAGYKKDTTIPEYRLFSHADYQYPDFYVDESHAGTMLPLLKSVTEHGDAVSRWRVVVNVVAKNGKVYFNPKKITAIEDDDRMPIDGEDAQDRYPF